MPSIGRRIPNSKMLKYEICVLEIVKYSTLRRRGYTCSPAWFGGFSLYPCLFCQKPLINRSTQITVRIPGCASSLLRFYQSHTHTHTHIHMYIYIYIYTHIHTYIYIPINIYIYSRHWELLGFLPCPMLINVPHFSNCREISEKLS